MTISTNRLLIAGIAVTLFIAMSAPVCQAAPGIYTDGSTLDFGTVTKEDLDIGYIEPAPSSMEYMLRIYVDADLSDNWVVSIGSDSPNFYSTGSPKPCGDLKWRVNGSNGPWNDIAPFASEAASGTGNATIDLDFMLRISWRDEPETNYGLTLAVTISEEF